MNSSVTESRSEAIDVKDFTRRRMWHVILPLFIVSIIAFLDRVKYCLCWLNDERKLALADTRGLWHGAQVFSLLAMFSLRCLHL